MRIQVLIQVLAVLFLCTISTSAFQSLSGFLSGSLSVSARPLHLYSTSSLSSSNDNGNNDLNNDLNNDNISALQHPVPSLRSIQSAIEDLRNFDASRKPKLVSRGESSMTRIWDLQTWSRHQNANRYWRHLVKWPMSTTVRIVFPVVLSFVAWAIVFHNVRKRFLPNFTFDIAPLSLISSAVALLLTLRTNQSLGRLQEARLAWGRLVLHSRDLSSLLASYISPSQAEICGRHLLLLGWSLKARLRGEAEDDVIKLSLSPSDAEYIMSQRRRTVALLRRIRLIVASEVEDNNLDGSAHEAILLRFHELNACIGVSERLLGSPSPPTYTRHTSRVLLSWLALVPLGLESMSLSLPLICLWTTIVAYVMVGIDEIGVQLEQPFQLLPLNSLSAALMRDVVDEIEEGLKLKETHK